MMNRLNPYAWIFTLLWFAGLTISMAADKPLLHPLFSDHGVVQRDCALPVWGWADPGTRLTISFAGQKKHATADTDGKWTCFLDPLAASFENRDLTVEATSTGRKALARHLLVGDLWLCSGQSNMEMGMMRCEEEEEIAQADHPHLRLLTIPQHIAYAPQETFTANWQPCSPETIRQGSAGGFSATAYFFGKKLQEDLAIPIGLIHSSWGGTIVEAWTSGPALKPFPDLHQQLKEVADVANSSSATPLIDATNAWFLKHDPGTTAHWHEEDTDTSDWRQATLPNNWADCGIPGGYEGVVWVRRHIDLPTDWANQPMVIQLGTISDTDTTWINGQEIGRTNFYDKVTRYKIPKDIVRGGRNVITLRITNAGSGGFQTNGAPMFIHPQGKENEAIALSGPWQVRESAKLEDTGRPLVGNPNAPSVLYNGMIAPLRPFAMTGVIWYQGEANTANAHQYRGLLPAMITDWRNQFDRETLAFHIVSLANYMKSSDQPRDDAWAELREAQAMTAKALPGCGLAVTIDIGDAHDIHPKNKREVGRRLALSALASTYQKPVSGSGPWMKSINIEGSRIRIHFDHTDDGLDLRKPSTKSFAIAGNDRKFVWANAVVDGQTIIVSSPDVPDPVAVRYAWDCNPQASLYNGAGLPAVPFRSDNWPGITD